MLVDKQSEPMSDLLFTVHQHGDSDVTWKPPTERLMGSWFPERSSDVYSVCWQERIQQLALQYSALFALICLRLDLETFQIIDKNVRTSQELDFRLIKTSKNSIHIDRPTP